MHGLLIDLTGKKFEKLFVLERFGNKFPVRWTCVCDCGNASHPSSQALRNGLAKSCGCLIKEKLKSGVLRSKGRAKHKKLYKVWDTMKQRCSNPNHKNFKRYGERGISFCEKWKSFDVFFEEIGYLWEDGLSIDRIDNDKGYCKENCRWITKKENCNNTSKNIIFTLDNYTDTLKKLCEKFGFKYKRVHQNLTRTGSFEKAIEIERRHYA